MLLELVALHEEQGFDLEELLNLEAECFQQHSALLVSLPAEGQELGVFVMELHWIGPHLLQELVQIQQHLFLLLFVVVLEGVLEDVCEDLANHINVFLAVLITDFLSENLALLVESRDVFETQEMAQKQLDSD